jgi:hypothetical protein
MKTLNDFLKHLNRSEARSALYYLSRFLKQAAYFRRYSKDIFEDTDRSGPSTDVRNVTLSIIEMIESTEGVAASEFDDATYTRWATQARRLEAQLDPELTESELARVRAFSSSLDLPGLKS